jgi:hypothetical protein
MADACGSGCGWCGACSRAYEGHEPHEPPIYCAAGCGQIIDRVSIAVLTTDYHSVTCCSQICAENLLAELDDAPNVLQTRPEVARG